MGIVSSKLMKTDSKQTKVSTGVQTETPMETTEIPDVRSPTADIVRTPIIVEKLKFEGNCQDKMPLKNKLLRNLKLDPRSPTVGIYRTPILIEDTPSRNSTPASCDSSASIYSSNVNDIVAEDLMTPIEPSMTVSEFEVTQALLCGGIDISFECDDKTEKDETKSNIKVSDKPNTYEAKKLLEDLISDEENFLKKMKMPSKKGRKTCKNSERQTKTKARPPLSNITSSTNSPGNIITGVKHHSKNKVLPEFGAENSVTPNAKHRAQWDQNNTIVI